MSKKRKDGRYSKQFNISGKRYTVYGKTMAECRNKEAEKRMEVSKGLLKPGKEKTISEYFESWIESKRDTVKETTIRTDRTLFNTMSACSMDSAGTLFGMMKLKDIETQNIRDLQNAMRQEREIRKEGKTVKRKACSTRTVNDSISLLRSIFQSAVNERVLTWNPAKGVKNLKRVEKKARDTYHRALTKEETATFLEKAAENKSWYYNLYVFLLHTGCRVGEAGAIVQTDIVGHKGVNISRTITRTESGGYMIGTETKTAAGKRYIPLDDIAQKAIADQKAIKAMLYGDRIIDLSKPIFESPYGSLLKSSSVNADVEKICKAAGMKKFTVHAFRDTFATRCVESGMEVKSLQEILGHTDINMTLGLYAHAMEDRKVEQLKAVNFM